MSVQVFPDSFKREAVDRVANSGLTAGAVARELGPAWDGAVSLDAWLGGPARRGDAVALERQRFHQTGPPVSGFRQV